MNTIQVTEPSAVTQPAKLIYTAKAHTIGGRDGGTSRTSDGRLDVKFSLPGGPGSGTNPEQLLTAGWSACFIGAIKRVAARKKVRLPADPVIDAEVDLWNIADGFSLRASFSVSLPGLDHETAQEIIKGAHQTCPYSKATRGNIDLELNLV
jgi:osmotically inducible protein OsmC